MFIVVVLCLQRATSVSSTNVGSQWDAKSLYDSIVSDKSVNSSDYQQCNFPPEARVRGANLTTAEAKLLPLICWSDELSVSEGLYTSVRKGIPSGVTCKSTKW